MQAQTRYHPDAEQLALAGTIEESLDSLVPVARLHAALEESADAWSSLRDLGVFGISVDEARGGSGLGAVEEALIVMGLGRRLVSPAVLATIGAGPALVASGNADKNVAAAYRSNGRTVVVDESQTSLVLVREGDSATLYNSSPGRSIDRRLWLAGLSEIDTPSEPLARLDAHDVLRLRLIDAAALAGIAAAVLDMAVAYAGIREQFGRPIGTFQAIKHHCSNMAMAARCARDQTNFAAVALDDDRDDAALQVECALLVAGQAALDNTGKNIQIHGGIGFSDEADPHLFLKRAQLQLAIAGGLEATNARIANLPSKW
ncbi:acyl-CoA dehydrogenase family protein [Peristeroidobacter soli]|uniref:acyl-CoA dehydrogenase family protein n=1 Tax=Peristeroidobacter soli TaxID=2497877 RepID=UPI00101C68C2|nr:acyl-CoA dehydrogenase family protein [Peristeroidobacter soli]